MSYTILAKPQPEVLSSLYVQLLSQKIAATSKSENRGMDSIPGRVRGCIVEGIFLSSICSDIITSSFIEDHRYHGFREYIFLRSSFNEIY
jgi:hypothetical protein